MEENFDAKMAENQGDSAQIPFWNRQKINELARLKKAEKAFQNRFERAIRPQFQSIFLKDITYEEFIQLAESANEIIDLFKPFKR